MSYLKSLHLQRQQTGREQARSAVAFREYVRDAVDELGWGSTDEI